MGSYMDMYMTYFAINNPTSELDLTDDMIDEIMDLDDEAQSWVPQGSNSGEWHNEEKVMAKMSVKYPTLVFSVWHEDSYGENWVTYYHGGCKQIENRVEYYPDFDAGLLQPVAMD